MRAKVYIPAEETSPIFATHPRGTAPLLLHSLWDDRKVVGMTKPFLAIVPLVTSCTPAFSQTAGTDSVAVLTLTEAKIDQALFAKRLQKARYIVGIGVRYLHISPLTSQGMPQNARPTGEILPWKVQVSS